MELAVASLTVLLSCNSRDEAKCRHVDQEINAREQRIAKMLEENSYQCLDNFDKYDERMCQTMQKMRREDLQWHRESLRIIRELQYARYHCR